MRKRSSLAEAYSRTIYDNIGYLGTWLPGTSINVGTVGYLNNSIMVPIADLHSLGVEISTIESAAAPSIQIVQNAALKFKAAGQTIDGVRSIAPDQAGVIVTFERPQALVFHAGGCVAWEIANVNDVIVGIRELQHQQVWRPEFVLVSNVVSAESVLALMAAESGATVEIAADRPLGPASVEFDSIVAQGQIVRKRGIQFDLLTHNPSTPLFRVSRIRSSGLLSRLGGRGVVAADVGASGESRGGKDTSVGVEIYEVVPGVGLPDE